MEIAPKEEVENNHTITQIEYVSGWGAAFINISITFPLNKLMFRQQLHGIRIHKALQELHKDGLAKLYRGLLPPLLQKTTSMAIMFGTYHQYKRLLETNHNQQESLPTKMTAAFLSGTTEAVLVPFERIQILLQTRHHENDYKNTAHAFKELRVRYGFKEFYRGLSATLMRNGPSNILFFVGRDEVRRKFPTTDHQFHNFCIDFVSGAFLGAFISTVFFPINVVKARMQSTRRTLYQLSTNIFDSL